MKPTCLVPASLLAKFFHEEGSLYQTFFFVLGFIHIPLNTGKRSFWLKLLAKP